MKLAIYLVGERMNYFDAGYLQTPTLKQFSATDLKASLTEADYIIITEDVETAKACANGQGKYRPIKVSPSVAAQESFMAPVIQAEIDSETTHSGSLIAQRLEESKQQKFLNTGRFIVVRANEIDLNDFNFTNYSLFHCRVGNRPAVDITNQFPPISFWEYVRDNVIGFGQTQSNDK